MYSRNHWKCTSALASVLFLAATGSHAAGLPGHGHYVAGQGSISRADRSLTVSQSSTTGIIDWNSFSIGKNSRVAFDNGSGATLNRVDGSDLSRLAGSLHATGSLYLMNNSGVIVSGTGKVVTGGAFVASSGSLSNTAFLDKDRDFSAARASVVNRGSIVSGGETRLVGGKVANFGSIAASVATLRARSGEALDAGVIRAVGDARHDADILLISHDGRTKVTGDLFARNRNGSGGKIETSGRGVSIAGHIDAGHGGTWLVDPKNLTVDAAAAQTIDASLNAGTNVTLQTTENSASGPGIATKGAGDIVVDAALNWHTAATLSLDSYRDVLIEAALTGSRGTLCFASGGTIAEENDAQIDIHTLTGSSGGSFDLLGTVADLDGFDTNNHNFYLGISDNFKVTGAVDTGDAILEISVGGSEKDGIALDAALTGNTVVLRTPGSISQDASGIITANMLTGLSEGGVKLTAANQIVTLGAFDDPAQNANFQLNDARSLLISDGGVDYLGGVVTLRSTGTIRETTDHGGHDTGGGIAAHALNISAVGGIYLPGVDVFDLTSLTNVGGNVLFHDAPGTNITGVVDAGAGNLTIAGVSTISNLVSAGGTVKLLAPRLVQASVMEKGKGAIHAMTLVGDVHGDSLLLNGANVIANLGNIETHGRDFALTDNESLALTGRVKSVTALTVTGAGDNLSIEGELKGPQISLVAAGSIDEMNGGKIRGNGTLSLQAANGLALDDANDVGTLDSVANTVAGGFSFKDESAVTFDGGPVNVSGDLSVSDAASDGITIDDAIAVDGAVTLSAPKGDVEESASGSISAASLAAAAQANIILTGMNAIPILDVVSAGHLAEFKLNDRSALTIAGAVSGNSVEIVTTGTANAIAIDAKIDANAVFLTSAAGIAEDSGSGRIIAAALIGTSMGDAILNGANQIADVAFTTGNGNLSLTDDRDLSVSGEVNTGTGALSLTTQNKGAISVTGTLATQGTLNLNSVTNVTEDATTGAIDAGILNVTAQTGISLTSSNNNIAAIGTDTTASGPNKITQ
jgi:filamentous hemagglutinin family protein